MEPIDIIRRGRKVGVPSLDSRRWEEIAGRRRSFPIIYSRLAGHDLAGGGHFPSNNADRPRAGVGHQSGFIVSKDEFPYKSETLNGGVMKAERGKGSDPHGDGVGISHQMTGTSNEGICPTAFLVDDASKLAGVVVPRC